MNKWDLRYYGFNPPFFGGHQKVLSRQSGFQIIKNDLIQLILTARGERVMRPTFGTDVTMTLFDSITDETMTTLTYGVQKAIGEIDPRVNVRVAAVKDEDNSKICISVEAVAIDGEPESFDLEINL